ncbi:GGDEF domain-containing protein [Thalassotalea fusca]
MLRCLVKFTFLVLMLTYLQPVLAYGQNEEQSSDNESSLANDNGEASPLESDVLILDAKIVALVELSEQDPQRAQSIYDNLMQLSDNFNAAEQYLMFLVRANLDDKPGQENKVINWLNQAVALKEQIAENQLNTPIFNSAYLKLSETYARVGKFKEAFENKETYIWNFFGDVQRTRDEHLSSLNDKYATDIKLKENELLLNQSEMRALRIKEIENEKRTQQRNLIVLLVTAVVFVLLLVRQINVRRRLKQLAKTDSLTGLFNRRTLFEKGNELTSQSTENGGQISALLFDIDHFKQINDEYGHDAGDKIIIAVGQLGIETMRSRDVLARLGGEEFAAVLPDSSLEEAKAIAERLREKVESFQLEYDEAILKVTVSVGVANIRQVSGGFDNMLNASDEAMYEAKALGRNKVCCYQLSTEA